MVHGVLAIAYALGGGNGTSGSSASFKSGASSSGLDKAEDSATVVPALLDLRDAMMTSYYQDNDHGIAALCEVYAAFSAGQDTAIGDARADASHGAGDVERPRLEVGGNNGLAAGQLRRLKRACCDACTVTVDDAEVAASQALLFEWDDCVLS